MLLFHHHFDRSNYSKNIFYMVQVISMICLDVVSVVSISHSEKNCSDNGFIFPYSS